MKRQLVFLVFLTSVVVVAGQSVAQTPSLQSSPAISVETERALVGQYCAGCHNDSLKSGGFSWNTVDLAHPEQSAERVEKVIRKLRAGLMPPPGRPRPDSPGVKRFVSSLESKIDEAAMVKPYVGRSALHHLNRAEYAASVHDLLGLSIDVDSLLPPDVQSHGFDNMADVLTTSPALLEAYIRAASKVSRLAVGDTEVQPEVTTLLASKEVSQTRHVPGAPIGTRGGISVIHNFPVDGDYIFKLGFYYSVDGPLFGRIQGRSQQVEVSINGERVSLFTLDPNRTKWHDMQTPAIHVKAGPQRVSAAFLETFEGPLEDVILPLEQTLVDLNEADMAGLTSLPHLHDLEIRGPMKVTGSGDTPSRRKIFSCRPINNDEPVCAKKIITTLARQAYRRPVTEDEIADLMSLYTSSRNEGGFESGIRMAVQTILSNPRFLFRFERTPLGATPGSLYRISDLDFASRLSYFIWSSGPDEELLNIAAQNKLKDPVTIERQVRRMLTDPKAIALTNNFANQWLHLRNLKEAQPDAYQFLDFTKNLADSMVRETQLFFDSIVREDRNVLDLLTADYTFVDELLAKHYGIPNVSGSAFRRVQIPDKNRRGILGHASILTLTSVSTRTSPVGRGKYVMEVLLGTPPPPPPPNVPALKENATSGDAKMLSVRQRLDEHRTNEPCASCHKLMDPIGLSLENFDAVGAWRINDSGLRIDPSSQLFDGAKLDGPASLYQAILNHSDMFLSAFGESLMAYGLGRVVDYRDMPVLRSILKDAAKSGNRFSGFVLAIVKSAAFQMSVAEEPVVVGTDK